MSNVLEYENDRASKALTELFPPGADKCSEGKWLLSPKHTKTEKEKSICIRQVVRNTAANEP